MQDDDNDTTTIPTSGDLVARQEVHGNGPTPTISFVWNSNFEEWTSWKWDEPGKSPHFRQHKYEDLQAIAKDGWTFEASPRVVVMVAGGTTPLTPGQVEALTDWFKEGQRKGGCTSYGKYFNRAMEVACTVSGLPRPRYWPKQDGDLATHLQALDDVTLDHQETMRKLSVQQRKLVWALAELGESATAREISEVARLESNIVSAQLRRIGWVDRTPVSYSMPADLRDWIRARRRGSTPDDSE